MMGENAETLPPLIDPENYGRIHAKRREIWQMNLLDSRRFTKYARDRGVRVGSSSREGVESLWLLGLIKADLVLVEEGVGYATDLPEGLVEVSADEAGHRLYADARTLTEARVGAAAGRKTVPKGVRLLFHPFRLHVMHWIERLLRLNITPLSTLTTAGPESLSELTEQVLRWKDDYFGSPEFAEGVLRLNDRTAFAAFAEPLPYGKIFGVRSIPSYGPSELGLAPRAFLDLGSEELRRLQRRLRDERLEQHREEVTTVFQDAGLDRIKEACECLCRDSETLDPNWNLQNLLRITRGVDRLEIGGATGGALLLRTMAETLRRVAEEVFGTELPEEDESGFAVARPDFKQWRYGARRLLDDKTAQREFIRRYGLDVGPRVRWYVEGETEYAALAAVFGENVQEGVVLVNLRAAYVEKRLLAFLDSLRVDIDGGVYSFISLDPDEENRLRAVRRAAERDEMFGCFFVFEPDFELANFTTAELGLILWEEAVEKGVPGECREELIAAVSGAGSGKELFQKAREVFPEYFTRSDKGKKWGRRLMAYALEYPKKEDGKLRPIIEAVDLAVSALQTSYLLHRHERRTDPKSGRLLPFVPDLASKSFSEAEALLLERTLQVREARWAGECAEENMEAKVVVGTVPSAGTLLEPESGVVVLLGPAPVQ